MRTRLIALTLLSAVPAALFLAYSARNGYEQRAQSTRAQTLTIARLISAEYESNVNEARVLLGAIGSSVRGPEGLRDPECDERLARLLTLNHAYAQLLIADTSGSAVCSALPVNKPVSLGDRDYLKKALATGAFTTSPIIDGRLSGGKVVVAAQPLRAAGGTLIGAAIASLRLDWMRERLASANLPEQSNALLVDGEGLVLYSFRRPELEGKLLADAEQFRRHAGGHTEGTFEIAGIDGSDRFVSFRQLSREPDIFLRVAYPKADVYRVAFEALVEPSLAFLALVVSTIFVAWLGGQLLVARPIRRLTDAAGRLGQGDLAARTGLPHSADAIGQLALKLDELASHGQRTTRALSALSAGNRTIVRSDDEQRLLATMCKVVVEHGGYPYASVTYAVEDERRSIRRVADAGDDKGFFTSAPEITWRDDKTGHGTIGTAMRTGQPSVIRSIESDPRALPWRSSLLERGWRSIVSFPLMVERRCIGAFTLFAREPDAFDRAELVLLTELAEDLAFGISVLRDRLRKKEAEDFAERASKHDPIVGLPNLGWFLGHLAVQLETVRNGKEPLAVLFAHVPRMQELYEALGYDAGNQIMRAIAARLSSSHPSWRNVARVGFDDFAVALPKIDLEQGSAIARAVAASLQEPLEAQNTKVDVQIGFGISFFPGHGDSPDLLLRRAGIAAREAARKGQLFAPYQGTSDRESPARVSLAAELRGAIERRELTLHYQPKLDFKTNEVCSVEALLRWHRADGFVPPGRFVPVAEHTGLIRQMTELVIEMAVRQQRRWLDAGVRMPIAVNLSARNLYDPQLLTHIDGMLTTCGVPAEMLDFEVTESALMDEPEVARNLIASLQNRGSRVFIDDFGTGYSSLNYLVNLAFYALKIDRAFVMGMNKAPQARTVIESVISMAHSLKLCVTAEGVETAEELEELRKMGCDEVQGYFIARPMPAEELVAWLKARRSRSTRGAYSF